MSLKFLKAPLLLDFSGERGRPFGCAITKKKFAELVIESPIPAIPELLRIPELHTPGFNFCQTLENGTKLAVVH